MSEKVAVWTFYQAQCDTCQWIGTDTDDKAEADREAQSHVCWEKKP